MSRVVLLDENTGLYYTVLQDSLRLKKERTKKVKFARNEKQAGAIKRVEESFRETQNPQLVAQGIGTLLNAVVSGDCTSVSFALYRDELQVTFWERKGKGSEVLASFVFTSVEGFIAGIEGLI
jgi:hypothetical protein